MKEKPRDIWKKTYDRAGSIIFLIEMIILFFMVGFLVGVLWMKAPVILWKYLPVDEFNYSLWAWLLGPESWSL